MTKHNWVRPILVTAVLLVFAPAARAKAPIEGAIAYVTSNRIEVFDGDAQRRVTKLAPEDGRIAWSPNGERIAFFDDGLRIVEVRSGALRRTVITTGHSISWANNGDIWFRREAQLFRMRPSAQPEPIVTRCGEGPGEISGDGDWFAYADERGVTICATDASDSNRSIVQETNASAPRWSPDGSRLVYSADGEIATVAADGGAPIAIGRGTQPDWSLDGSEIVFVDKSALAIVRIDGKERRTLFPGSAPAWGRSAPKPVSDPSTVRREGTQPQVQRDSTADSLARVSVERGEEPDQDGSAASASATPKPTATPGNEVFAPSVMPPITEETDGRVLAILLAGGAALAFVGSGLAITWFRRHGLRLY